MNQLSDLHMHLDGSLPKSTVLKLAEMQNTTLPSNTEEGLTPFLSVTNDCKSLNEYLEKFDLPLSLLQTELAITTAVSDLIAELNNQGIKYAEIRFAPQLHTSKGLTQTDVINAAIAGIIQSTATDSAYDSTPQTSARLILCLMRGNTNEELNYDTVGAASQIINKENGKYIAGLDLAGAEALFPTENFADVFKEAKKNALPYTIHAGEAAGPDSIWKALEMGAKRIGHGIAAAKDPSLMKYLADNDIALEMCPTSNLQTKAVESIGSYPLRTFLEAGIPVTINTDNMTVSNTTLATEFKLLQTELHITEEEKSILIANAENHKL